MITYDQLIEALPYLFGAVYTGAAFFVGKHVVYQARDLYDALWNKGKRYVDDPNDWLIKQAAKAFKITPEQAIKALQDVGNAPVEAKPLSES